MNFLFNLFVLYIFYYYEKYFFSELKIFTPVINYFFMFNITAVYKPFLV